MAEQGFTLASVPQRVDFPAEEEKTLKHWQEVDAFKTSLKRTEGKPEYTFYDGPPFATGLPHYGHILAGSIKDVVTRYATQMGYHVDRRFGWDTHGLPIEFMINKQLGVNTPADMLKLGVKNLAETALAGDVKGLDAKLKQVAETGEYDPEDAELKAALTVDKISHRDLMQEGIKKYNTACRSVVMRYSKEWETIVTRLGRWIDFENDYKTMNPTFMESVWSVFKRLDDKDLVYKGMKVMPYSTGLNTALSNFEAKLNYKDTQDPAVTVKLKVDGDDAYFLAWTTTPWTLPSNLALCVNADMEYVKIKDVKSDESWILAKARLTSPGQLYKKPKPKKDYVILETYKGADLVGKTYEPLFPYFASKKKDGCFRVLSDPYVSADSGTGVVHQAPGFGEDDYRVCLREGVIQADGVIICPINDVGEFTEDVPDYQGIYCKTADKQIQKDLKARGLLAKQSTIKHNYPFCWRSEKPLLYKAVPSWFVRVTRIRDRLLKNNEKTYWVPDHVKSKRFHNWLEGARDWAVSRNRYWGTPVPIWISDDGKEWEVIGSIADLEKKSGVKGIKDIHRESIDDITITSKKTGKVLRRIPEVFDCWFESGSMPYAQVHYPFSITEEEFHKRFPADFIAEGLDQTRGWFYTLMVLSTALFDKPAFKNLVVNGLVLAENGKKMSKSKKNYPDPMLVVNKYGADALRLYLINSPVVRAEPLKFSQEGVHNVLKDIFIPWCGTYRLLVLSSQRFEKTTGEKFAANPKVHLVSKNVMDRWIIASLQTLVRTVRTEMFDHDSAGYRLYNVIPALIKFLTSLSQWYVRLNKKRLRGQAGNSEEERVVEFRNSLHTLYHVLFELCKLMAPFTPYLVEMMYQNLKKCQPQDKQEDSVHYLLIPEVDPSAEDPALETSVARLQQVIKLGWKAREARTISHKVPLADVTVVHPDQKFLDDVQSLQSYVTSIFSLNVKEVKATSLTESFVRLTLEGDQRALGKRLRKNARAVVKVLPDVPHQDVVKLQKEGKLTVSTPKNGDHEITLAEVKVVRCFQGDESKYSSAGEGELLVVLNTIATEELKQEGDAREVVNRIQNLRKEAGLEPTEEVEVYYSTSDVLRTVITTQATLISDAVRLPVKDAAERPADAAVIINQVVQVADQNLELWLVRPKSS